MNTKGSISRGFQTSQALRSKSIRRYLTAQRMWHDSVRQAVTKTNTWAELRWYQMSRWDQTDHVQYTRFHRECLQLPGEAPIAPPVQIIPRPMEAALLKKLMLYHTWQWIMTCVTLDFPSLHSPLSSPVRTERTKSPGWLWLSRTRKLPCFPFSVNSFSASLPERCPWNHL